MNIPFAIKFGDNDFGHTFIPLVRALTDCNFQGTKLQFIALINETIYSFYLIYQANGNILRESGWDHIRNYLKVSEREVYFGQDEVDGFFKDPSKIGNTNHDFYYWYPGQEPQVM